MKKVLFFILLSICQIVLAQDKGTIKGVLSDKEMNGEPLPFANVVLKGTSIGTTTDLDGMYTLSVPTGNQTLVFSFIGYQTIEKPVIVKANETIVVNETIGANDGVSLDEVVVKATKTREKESALLLEQKKAVVIKTTIGAQELSKKGVSDIATAVTKASGISKQEGSNNVYVRGLGDRYNSTTLNGLPLPSNNPSKKNIGLDIFSTDIVQVIDINKIYNSNISGDFGGANINIVSKEHTGKPSLTLKIGSGVNTNAALEKHFYLQDGPDFYGFYNTSFPNNALDAYNFTTSWDSKMKAPYNGNLSLTGGKKFEIGEEGSLSLFGTISFGNGYKFKEGVSRGSINSQGLAVRDLTFKSYDYNTNTTGMLNLAYKLNNKHTLRFSSLFINSSNQSLDDYNGTINIFDIAENGGGFIRRSTFDKTAFYVNQLLGKHKIFENVDAEWGIAFNKIKNIVPDRRQNTLEPTNVKNPNGSKTVSVLSSSDNHRFFQNLDENEYAFNGAVNYSFDKDEDEVYKGKATLGYSGKWKDVNFEATQFNFRINKNITQPTIDVNNLDAYFNQNSFDNNYFEIETFRGAVNSTLALKPQIYEGRQIISATFGSVQYNFNENFTAIAGVRLEQIYQKIKWETAIDPIGGKNYLFETEVLPSISLKYKLNDEQNLKFAASKSYTLPQFKERAPFQFEEVTQIKVGNPYLYASNNYNVDLRWEMFPKPSEVISITAFGKLVKNPINEVVIASATNDISYVNSGEEARIIGAEFEIRKELFNHVTTTEDKDLDSKLTAGFNTSYMYTNQDFNSEKVISETNGTRNVNFTNKEGALTGASNILINADISYLKEFTATRNLLTTLSFNYFSDRVYAIGSAEKGDLIDNAVPTLDFILKSKISNKINVGLAFKNILNPTVKRTQEIQNVEVLSFKKGLNLSFSFSYKLD